jgi:hypothetical protein
MSLFYKYYTCDVVRDGALLGSSVVGIPFFRSPQYAFLRLVRQVGDEDCDIANFRRIK